MNQEIANSHAKGKAKRKLGTGNRVNRWLSDVVIQWVASQGEQPVKTPENLPFLLDIKQLCELLGVHRDTIVQWRKQDSFPEPINLTPRHAAAPKEAAQAQ